ncbi:MAG: mechanosensitive ion channel family protein [Erysipelotrichaceae bacterium]
MKDYLVNLFEDFKTVLPEILVKLVLIILIFVCAKFIMSKISAHTKKTIDRANTMEDKEKSKTIVTSMTMTRSVCRYVVYFIAFLIVMNILGYGSAINNILVTAGVGAMIVSLGAQSLIKDVITGILLLFEKQYSVGDYVKINDYEGFVTSIAMRVTYLDSKGKKIIIPNGQINTVVNYTNSYSLFELTIPTSYKDDTNQIIALLKEVLDKYYLDNKEKFVNKPVVQGISKLNDSSIDIYINGRVKALNQWSIERELRLLILNSMKDNGFEIPFNQIDVNMK